MKSGSPAIEQGGEPLFDLQQLRISIFFHHFSFLPPLFVLTLTALYVFEFPNQFFIFCASLCGDAIKLTNSALAQYWVLSIFTPKSA